MTPRLTASLLIGPLALVCASACGQSSSPSTATATGAGRTSRPTLSQVLEQSLAPFHARTSVYVKNLETGEEAGVRADEAFNSFSVIKLGIMLRAYQLSDQKQLNLDERIEVKGSDLRDGSGMLYTFDEGLRVTLRDLITQMIITSDNTATDMLLDRVGGLEVLNAWLTSAVSLCGDESADIRSLVIIAPCKCSKSRSR